MVDQSQALQRAASLYIVSAPSGAGKTSLVRALIERLDNVCLSISHTTRMVRPGEQGGLDYHFVSKDEFERMVDGHAFLEYARVFDNSYGTSKAKVIEQLGGGHDVILEIDWQGARQIRAIFPESVLIFILPPSREALEQRLRNRGQDDEATIKRRMGDAVAELSHYDEYDHLIVNDDFEVAFDELSAIINSRRQGKEVEKKGHEALIQRLIAG